MNYVPTIEPRLTNHRPAAPGTVIEVLVEWLRDLEQEAVARLQLMSEDELGFRPHPDANNPDVTFWHVARWFDVLAARHVTRPPARAERWLADGWADLTGYDPTGIGFLGLGTLTGYTPEEMRAVPELGAEGLRAYLTGAIDDVVDAVSGLTPAELHAPGAGGIPSAYQVLGSTIQGAFGHLGEVDCLVSLNDRTTGEAYVHSTLMPGR